MTIRIAPVTCAHKKTSGKKNYYVIYIRAFHWLGLVRPFFWGVMKLQLQSTYALFYTTTSTPHRHTPGTHTSVFSPEKFEAVHVTRTRAIYTCYQLDCCRRISFCLRKLIFAIFFCRN